MIISDWVSFNYLRTVTQIVFIRNLIGAILELKVSYKFLNFS